MHLFCVFFALFLCITTIFAQSSACLSPCDVPEDLKYCSSINYPLYPIQDFPGSINYTSLFFESPTLATLKIPCRRALEMLSCKLLFVACAEVDGPIPILPVSTCVDMCHNVHTECAEYIAAGKFAKEQMDFINCSSTYMGYPVFAPGPNCMNLTTLTPNPTCPQYANRTGPPTQENRNTDGGCQAFSMQRANSSSYMCSPYINEQIFVPDPFDPRYQDVTDFAVKPLVDGIMTVGTMVPIDCFQAFSSLLCQGIFPTCTQVNASWQEPSPHSYEYCMHVNELCFDYSGYLGAERAGMNLVDCDSFTEGKPTYPRGAPNNELLPPNPVVALYLPNGTCPSVFGVKQNPGPRDPRCAFPCPDHAYSKSQLTHMTTGILVCASLSFISCIFLLISQLLIAEKRRFPSNMTLWMCGCVSTIMIAFFIGGRRPWDTTWCVDRGTYSNQSNNSRCTAQAFIFIYFGLVEVCILCLLSMTYFLAVVFSIKPSDLAKKMKWYHLFMWGYPAVFMIAILSKRMLGYSPFTTICHLVSRDFLNPNNSQFGFTLDYALYFIPYAVVAIATVVMLAWTEIRIFMLQKQVYTGTTRSAQRRVGVFIFWMILVLVIVLQTRFQLQTEIKSLSAKVGDWYACKIRKEIGMHTDATCDGDVTPTGITFGQAMMSSLLPSLFGIILFFLFGIDKSNYVAWPVVYRYMFVERDGAKLWQFIKAGHNQWENYDNPKHHSKGRKSDSGNSGGENFTPTTQDVARDGSIKLSVWKM